ncbi:YPL137C [Saccharomyces arboricola H-6]|uniref:YPL137C n=1 Tax=Saccharomyces arboricola (strain H-6 / AS 2.3317 / CBS 10644) TaxID=1160507 RepID=J8PH05_SACAR|nr:YPL137C [Saccharomyces arboricola H-6]
MITNTEFDVPVDWLYKGKSRRKTNTKPSRPSTSPASTSSTSAPKFGNSSSSSISISISSSSKPRARSSSVSNAALSNIEKPNLDGGNDNVSGSETDSIPLLTPINSGNRSISADIDNADFIDDGSNKNTIPLKKKKRSTSISNAVVSSKPRLANPNISATAAPSLAKGKLPPISSLSNANVKRSNSSSGEKSKRSIFGSLFGKRSASSSVSTAKKPLPAVNTPMAVSDLSKKEPPSDNGKVKTNATPKVRVKELPSPMTASPTVSKLPTPMSPVAPVLPSSNLSIENLSTVSLKRVSFAVDKFESDPPQQLPSRTPKKGNILIPDDMVSEVPSISVGISSTNQSTKSSNPNTKGPLYTKKSKEYILALENQKLALREAAKHQQEAHFAANRIAFEVSSFKTCSKLGAKSPRNSISKQNEEMMPPNVDTDQDFGNNTFAENLGIDKPIHMHEHHFEDPDEVKHKNNYTMENKEVTLDVIYTRCCHLREILPIPSTLRQVKDKTAPLQILKFLNPKPTLIDILSFCDFITIIPVHTIIFDNVALNQDMFKIIISALVNSTVLEKLSLRNVRIDQDGWKLLCKFLLLNKSLNKLDISQTKIKSDLAEPLYRHSMNWNLFTEVLTQRSHKPLEELLLNGIQFDKIPYSSFERLLTSYATQKTMPESGIRLGLAGATTSNISQDCLKFIFNWMSQYNVQGVDLAFNDLSTMVKPMVGKLSALPYESLRYFILNSTNISTSYDLALLLKYLSKLPNLIFLDLSNLPQCFPDILPYMYKYLPRFPNLKRIHLDNNNLTLKELAVVCNILIKCKSLSHVSMAAQNVENFYLTSGGDLFVQQSNPDGEPDNSNLLDIKGQFAKNSLSSTLYAFARDSPNLIGLDFDYDLISEEIQSRIALCLMRNMKRTMDSTFQLDELDSQDDLIFDGSLVTMTAESVLEKLNLLSDKDPKVKKDTTKRYLLKKYIEKFHILHHNVQHTIDSMFEKRKSGELPLQEKENLVRLLLLEQNLCNILELFSHNPNLNDVLGSTKDDSKESINSNDDQKLPALKHVESGYHASEEKAQPENDVITARPHLMATDSGKTIDVFTGKPLVFKNSSLSTSVGCKKQEEEEGELHKWGFFVQQQRSLYPENESARQAPPTSLRTSTNIPAVVNSTPSSSVSASTNETAATSLFGPVNPKILPKIPSGAALRSAIIKAKGIDSIDDLIQNVNSNNIELENIYGESIQNSASAPPSGLDPDVSASIPGKENPGKLPVDLTNENSCEGKVTATYDKLLNNLSMERSTKL